MATTHKMSFSKILVNDQLAALNKWCEDWRTKINPTKSTAMVLGGARQDEKGEPITITYAGEDIPITTHFKYLGVQIDQHLTFTRHVNHIISSVATKTASLMAYFKKGKIVNRNTRIDLYKLLIQPRITYGLPSWGGTSNNQLKKLLVIERKWIRICTCIPKSTPIAIQYQLAPFKTIF